MTKKKPDKADIKAAKDHINLHEHTESVLNRLSRIEGHVRAVKHMVEEGTPCPEVLIQIAAVRAALNSVGQVILDDHMKSCMVNAVQNGDYEEAFRDLKLSLTRFIG
jgi:CsoR family transcriptional regulator, copper-sensing transcriptional repressor